MQTRAHEICESILLGNIPRANQLAEAWLTELPLSNLQEKTDSILQPADYHKITRYLIHRHERLSGIPAGVEKSRELKRMVHELVSENPDSDIRRSAVTYYYAQIADGFARDFAGQKSHQLNSEDLLDLSYALIMIKNFTSASETLQFLLNHHRQNPSVHYLLAHTANMLGESTRFFEHYREALFLKPEVVSEYPEFLPGGAFHEMYQFVIHEGYPESKRDKVFALLLELNGSYPFIRKLKTDEVRNIEIEYAKWKKDFENSSANRKDFQPRLLHVLCWLVWHAHQTQNLGKYDIYRAEMTEIDSSAWTTFYQNNFGKNKGL